ncbi:MAG: AAA family ATPase [Candidatus Thiodiazotropha sp. (ex Lucinoma kastoroae)]|nr:AAA family ATPase [Candidatus Thiodiazotropha sp. (ex Lucinoma kastoroae)]
MAIKSVIIEHLRGSVTPFTLQFEKGKKLTVIYGENGTGKSTICDAFDFIGNGKVGSLENKGLNRTGKYWHTMGSKPTDTTVTLELSKGVCKAVSGKGSVLVEPEDHRPHVSVLRRSQILNLVEARPAERYTAISHFIDVAGVEASEASLRTLIRDIESQINVAIARIQENRDTIDNFWEQAGKVGNDAIQWAKNEITYDMSSAEAARSALDKLQETYGKLLAYPETFRTYNEEISDREAAIEQQKQHVGNLNEKVAGEYVEILEILQAAQRYFDNHSEPDVCPLCESAENVAGLPTKVKEWIKTQAVASQLQEAKRKLVQMESSLEQKKQALEDLNNISLQDAEKFAEVAKDNVLPSNCPLPDFPYPTKLEDWENWLSNSKDIARKWRELSDECADSKRFVETLKASLATLETNSQIQQEFDVLLPRLKRASLKIAAEFQGQEGTPPQAYFSDSHLDTLGLCVFLALAQREKPEETILVLDDVLGSVDEPHVERLVEMLYEEAKKFRQCIITTHYRPWKEKFRWGWLKNGQCQFIELKKWSSDEGILLARSIPEIERLRRFLSEGSPDLQSICAKAGVLLESALEFLTLTYECHVPRRTSGLYALGELLPAIDKKLRKALKVEHKQEQQDGSITYIEKELEPHLNELTRIMQARNLFGAHFNALSFDMLDADALAFGMEVLALMDCLIDQDAGGPRNKKSGSYWATAGETRRMHPLQRPN